MPATVKKYLVTGIGGTGKSAIQNELSAQGYIAKDADSIPGLSGWVDLATNKPTTLEDVSYVDYSKVAWNWNGGVLQSELDKNETIFICGSASNQEDFYKLFDRVFILDVSADIHRDRLINRESPYGKTPEMIENLVNDQKKLLQTVDFYYNAVAVDANGTIDETARRILQLCK